ncbi:MAG: GNAT family N-acetyltransferase [Gammaproteobacteria bacterium]|nr:GNAT family N-acetyltransferase [Gammaproteobacteria bacterium]
MIELSAPCLKYKSSFIKSLHEGFNPNSTSPAMEIHKIQAIENNFSTYLYDMKKPGSKNIIGRDGKTYKRVPQDTYWLVKDNDFIGSINIRHGLSGFLIQYGGHIGYAIRPSQRRQGYATLILKMGLEKLRDLGIERALVTTSEHNIGSQKTILNNGGILENTVAYDWLDYKEMRFWVDL